MDSAPAQVVDLLVARLIAWPGLLGWTILSDHPGDTAFEEQYPLISIGIASWAFAPDDEQSQTQHEVELDFEIISTSETPGLIGRKNMAAVGQVIGALAVDRTLGGIVEDIQEMDAAPVGQTSRDASATSLRARTRFYTPRDDIFTIV